MSQLIFPISKNPGNMLPRRGESKGLSDKRFLTAILQICFIILTFFMIYNIFKSISLTNQKLQILSQAQQEVELLRLENIRLYLEKSDSNTNDYLEAEARNRLFYSRPGETQYIIPDTLLRRYMNSSATATSSTSLQDKTSVNSWVDFFIKGI
jgi:cell division protein FtsB